MREKLLRLMQTEGLTSSRLAELLETQPSSISHLLSGRNKPSFDLIQKILRRFPRINPDWLLLDSDRMFRNDVTEFTAPALFADDNPNESSAGTDSTDKRQTQVRNQLGYRHPVFFPTAWKIGASVRSSCFMTTAPVKIIEPESDSLNIAFDGSGTNLSMNFRRFHSGLLRLLRSMKGIPDRSHPQNKQ